jgi:hypothetical protein
MNDSAKNAGSICLLIGLALGFVAGCGARGHSEAHAAINAGAGRYVCNEQGITRWEWTVPAPTEKDKP